MGDPSLCLAKQYQRARCRSAQEFLFCGGKFGVGKGAAIVEVGETGQFVGEILPAEFGCYGRNLGLECCRGSGVSGGVRGRVVVVSEVVVMELCEVTAVLAEDA
jgi:hypothetical protein